MIGRLKPLLAALSYLWKWVRTTPHVSGLALLISVLVMLFLQSQNFAPPFDDSPRNGIELLQRRGWVPPTIPILWLRYLVPYLGLWLLVGGVVFHIALLRAWPDPRRLAKPVWFASFFIAVWGIASDLSNHLEYVEISVSGEPSTPIAYFTKLFMIGLACLTPAVGVQMYARATLLDRYTLRSFLAPAAFCFAAFCSLWILMDLLDSLKDFQEVRTPLHKILLFYLNLIPFIYVSVAPAAILLGVLYSLTKMSRANEIVSMLGAGRSVAQILRPIFLCALGASILSMAANYYWAPRAEGNRQAIMRALMEGEAGTIMARALMYHNEETRRTWYAGSFPFNLRDEKIRNIEVRQEDENGKIVRAWIANSAFWWKPMGKPMGTWSFYKGQEIIYENGRPVKLVDYTGRFPPASQNQVAMPNDSDGSASELSSMLLNAERIDVSGISETPWSIVSSALVPDFMGVPDLVSYLKAHDEDDSASLAPFHTHFYHRFALPFQCLVLALVAAPLGIAYSRRGSLGGIAASIFIFFSMIFVNDVFLNLGKGSHLPPWLTVWIPNLAYGLLGGLMLYLRSQNKELPKFSIKTAKVARPRNRTAAPSPA